MVALTVRKNVSLALIKASRDYYFLLIYVIQNVPFFPLLNNNPVLYDKT